MMQFRLFIQFCCVFAVCVGTLVAQDEKSAEPSPAKEKYSAVYQEWKDLLSEMRLIRTKADNANDSEIEGLQVRFDELIQKGEGDLIPRLRDAAVEAYREAQNEDNQITRWLATVANDDVTNDRFADAEPILDVLIEGETTAATVFNNAGIVAFVHNDYDKAKELLTKAANNGAMNELSESFGYTFEQYVEYWEREKKLREAAEKAEGEARLPQVMLKTTKGDILVELFEDEAPETVGNFISLVEKGFYDGLTFHRVLNNFMVQGGCPEGTGMGGPGYRIYCECVNPNNRKHFAGTLSMAHSGRDTGGSQFFMTLVPTPHLNDKHTAFGRIIEGFDVLAKIQKRDTDVDADLMKTPDKIIQANVVFKRNHDYVPNKK